MLGTLTANSCQQCHNLSTYSKLKALIMATYLDYDNKGFIVGTRKLESGIKSINDDTQEIIEILKSQNQINNTVLHKIARSNERIASKRVARSNSEAPVYEMPTTNTRQASKSQPSSKPARAKITSSAKIKSVGSESSASAKSRAQSSRSRNSKVSNRADTVEPGSRAGRVNNPNGNNGRTKSGSDRDNKGRFTSKDKSLLDRLSRSTGRSGIDPTGAESVDPLVASAGELRNALSPFTRGAGIAGKAAFNMGKMSFTKYKALKRKEPLPKEQQRHNKQNEETLGEILKRMGGNNGGSLLGTLASGLGFGGKRRGKGKGLGRALGGAALFGKRGGGKVLRSLSKAKFLGPIAAALGVGGLATQWDSLDHKGKLGGVGSLGGGFGGAAAGAAIGTAVFPGVGTAVGGVLGGWLGSEGGEALGEAASPYIKSWTDSVKNYNLANKLENSWEYGLTPFFNSLKSAASGIGSWIGEKGRGFIGGLGDMMGFGGSGAPTKKAEDASAYAIKNAAVVSLGACAKYVNDAFRAQGLKAGGHGVDAAKNLINMNKGKFDQVAYNENYVPQIGDVMSMPSNSKSKHNYGHVAVYTDAGWVSDFKQGDKYGNTAAPNRAYYDEIMSGKIKPTIARMKPDGSVRQNISKQPTGDRAKLRDTAMRYFMSQGWTKEQAAGIVANLQKESQYNHRAQGDKDKYGVYQAYGLAQWHPDRQKDFKNAFGKDIRQASYKEQLAFVNYELTKGKERAAGNKLKQAKTAGKAGAIVSEFYERPSDKHGEIRDRAGIAQVIYKGSNVGNTGRKSYKLAEDAKKSEGILGFSPNKLGNGFMPGDSFGGYKPAGSSSALNIPSMALKSILNIPDMPSIRTQLSSGGGSGKPIVVQSNSEAIGQNVSDRDLAHAITGGLGMQRMWH